MAIQAGTRLGPYEIVAPLGAGGMGEVYRARDTRLGRDVAIKVLPARFASDPDRLHRFEQEARAVAALDHPNILALHDVGTHEGAPYLVTELLEGESLRERLRDGALPSRKVVELAVQVCAGLAAAHEKGIVHRDLKPENLFITNDGHVKILDFGVAKLKPPQREPAVAPTLVDTTAPGMVIGTVAYMSPEQVRGRTVDHRSDIFSLGCVLYEMLTGKQAFTRDTAADTLSAILKEEPPDLTTVKPGAPPALAQIVSHCLEKHPEERFQSTRDLAFDLRAVTDTAGTHTNPLPALAAKRRRLVWIVAVAAAVAVVVGAFLLSRARTASPGSALESKRIVVAVFENQTGDRSLDPLGRMASDWITQGLSRMGGLEVVPSTSVLVAQPPGSPAPAHRDPLRALAEDTGASIVVSGSYYLQGQTLYFQAKVSDAVRGALLYALDPASGAVATPLEAIDNLRRGVMGALAAALERRSGITWGEQRPPNYEAYREFMAGFELFFTDNPESLQHMERAAELDPNFVTPLLYAVYLRRVRGEWAEVETLLKRANEQRGQITPFGRYFLDGETAWIFHRYGEGLQAIRSARELAPRDPLANLWIGYLAIQANRPGEAVAVFSSFPKQPWGGHSLGAAWVGRYCDALHMLGRHQDELAEARHGREQFAEDSDVRGSEISALAALGRLDEVQRALREIEAAPVRGWTLADAMLVAARELRAHGHRQESVALAEGAVAWHRERPREALVTRDGQRELAWALFWAERWGDSRLVYETLVAGGSREPGDLGMVGVLAARTGDRATATRISSELEHLTGARLFGDHTYYRAGIAATLGDKERAVALLREAFTQGQAFGITVHSSLLFESLSQYRPFAELIRPKG